MCRACGLNLILFSFKEYVQSIYKFGLSVCLFVWVSVCLFVSNKRQNGWTDRGQIFCGTSRDPREGLWMIKISNICLHQNSISIKFFKILKIHEIFCENPRIIFVLFYDVQRLISMQWKRIFNALMSNKSSNCKFTCKQRDAVNGQFSLILS